MARRGTGVGGYLLVAALALGSLGAAPTRTPTPTPTPSPTRTPVASPSRTPTSVPTPQVSPTLTATPPPIVMPDLPVASVREMPTGSAPLLSHAWMPAADLQAAIEAAV